MSIVIVFGDGLKIIYIIFLGWHQIRVDNIHYAYLCTSDLGSKETNSIILFMLAPQCNFDFSFFLFLHAKP